MKERFDNESSSVKIALRILEAFSAFSIGQACSVTSWLDNFVKIWPFVRTKNCHNSIKVGQIRFKNLPNTNPEKLPNNLKFWQSGGGILPNLVTLEVPEDGSHFFWWTINGSIFCPTKHAPIIIDDDE